MYVANFKNASLEWLETWLFVVSDKCMFIVMFLNMPVFKYMVFEIS